MTEDAFLFPSIHEYALNLFTDDPEYLIEQFVNRTQSNTTHLIAKLGIGGIINEKK